MEEEARYKFFGITIGVSDLVKVENRQVTLLPEAIAKVVGVILFLKFVGYAVCHSFAENKLLGLIANRFYTYKAPDPKIEKQKTSSDIQILPYIENDDEVKEGGEINEEDNEFNADN